jgi:7 transmembrane receptor (rhodopsin family)
MKFRKVVPFDAYEKENTAPASALMNFRTRPESKRHKRANFSRSQVVAFSICWAPIQIILLLKSLRLYDTTTLSVSIQIISHVLAYLNSCLNPFLYAFLSENFRKAFRKVMWCGPASSQYTLAAPDTKSTRTGTRHTGNGAASVDIL